MTGKDARRLIKRERECNVDEYTSTPEFEQFWNEYPKHAAKRDALLAWHQIGDLTPKLFQQIMSGLRWQKHTPQWSDLQFVPNPAKWLRGARWEDEPFEPPSNGNGKAIYAFECPHRPKCLARHVCDLRLRLGK
jgi:hypothetical protein